MNDRGRPRQQVGPAFSVPLGAIYWGFVVLAQLHKREQEATDVWDCICYACQAVRKKL
jgi:hypothetical protein